jgi:hypothetical protein
MKQMNKNWNNKRAQNAKKYMNVNVVTLIKLEERNRCKIVKKNRASPVIAFRFRHGFRLRLPFFQQVSTGQLIIIAIISFRISII